MPIQEGSRSLATDKMMSNQVIYSSFDWTDHHESSRQSTGKSFFFFYLFLKIIIEYPETYNVLAVKPLNNYTIPVIQQTPIQIDTQKHLG